MNRPYIFLKLTTLEARIQTFQILTQWHSCALNGCSGAVPTHSLVFMCTQWVFRGCSIQFNTHSLAFTHTHKCSGGVQYSLTGIHAHSQAFRVCSVPTQMRSFSWSHHGESHSIMTQWQSCALIRCSHSLNVSHAHSMDVQGLFPLTHCHSCTLNVCSGAVQYSLIGVHVHSKVFRGCSILTQRHSAGSNT